MATRLELLRETLFLRGLALAKIPMILFTRPSVVALDEHHAVVRIALRRATRNHLGSMYFGALCVGADVVGGVLALRALRQHRDVQLVFKDFQAEFIRRPEGDVDFACRQGAEVQALVEAAAATGERQNLPLEITATLAKQGIDAEPVARMVLTLSLKKRKPKST